jgi:beta-glucosidase
MKNIDDTNDISFNYKKEDFGDNFLWGVSTPPLYATEINDKLVSKTSFYDKLSPNKNSVTVDESANSITHLYANYKDDIMLSKELGIPNFRFSISWSRILPIGVGEIDQEGINFYNNILDTCKEYNIEPFVTLFERDLPLELEKKGGWTNRAILEWFEEYLKVCATAFKDKVKYWIILNEPSIFLGAGYFLGVDVIGKKGLNNFLPAMHHALLCQSIGYKIIKQINPSAQIGTSISCTHITPKTYSEKNIKAAERIDALLNKAFIEPSLGLGYPTAKLPFLKHIKKYTSKGDEELIKVDFDFISLQNYTSEVVEHHSYTPYVNAKLIPANKRNFGSTLMNWETHPKSIYVMILKFSKYEGVKKIMITENEASFLNDSKSHIISDGNRISYLKNYLQQVLYAQDKSQKVMGYFIWSLTDTFEWIEGHEQKFGLLHTDSYTQQKIIKNSGKWFKKFLESK